MNELKQKICEIGKRLYDKGFVPGSSGNISVKVGDIILVTASGTCLGLLSLEDIIETDLDGNAINKAKNPSSERFMHVEIYKNRPEIDCIIHAHPPKSTALSVAGKELKEPLVAEAVISLGQVPIVPYETPSTDKLAKDIASYFTGHEAVLMANHGATVCGKGLDKTYFKMETLEFVSEIFLITEKLGVKNEIPHNKLAELIEIRKKLHS